jgi:hypothetical protein
VLAQQRFVIGDQATDHVRTGGLTGGV